MEIIRIPIDELTPDPNNAKDHPAWQIEQIKNSIEQFGNLDPIGVWGEDNLIVEGHGRYEALKELGYQEAECIRLDWLTEEERKAYALAHNKLTMNSGFIPDALDMTLAAIGEIDMSQFGFEIPEEEEPPEITEDEIPEEVETRCKLGDIWQLGEHRLICGDSTDVTVIDRLMDGVKADCVFTDPPYGMKKESEGVLNDNLNFDDLLDFNRQWIPLTFGALKDNGSWYCWGIDEPLMDIYSNILKPMARENKITFRNLISWDKGNGQGQLSEDFRMYPIADEKCLFVMTGVQGFNNNQDNYFEGFEPIRMYLVGELEKIGVKPGSQFEKILGSVNKTQHVLSKSHFNLITEPDYKKLQEYAAGRAFLREYDGWRKSIRGA